MSENHLFHLDGIVDLLNLLEPVFKRYEIDYFIIGALAIDYWFSKSNKQTLRTKDVDLAIKVDEKDTYRGLKAELMSSYDFSEVNNHQFSLMTPFDYPVDLLPFGGLAIDNVVELQGSGVSKINIDGLQEVHDKGVITVALKNIEVKVSTLSALILLKLIAFDDRPEKRMQDISDVGIIIAEFFDIMDEYIWHNHSDLFGDDPDLDNVTARVIGREMSLILDLNTNLKERLLNILALSRSYHKTILERIAQQDRFSISKVRELLEHISVGLEE